MSAMHRSELVDFISRIKARGTHSSVMLGEVMEELAQHIPLVLHLADTPYYNSDGMMKYKITDTQSEINAIIHELSQSETPTVIIHDKGMTLNFSHIEISDDRATCYLTTFDGYYTLYLSNEDNFSELTYSTN